jgi:hypothetical protein
MSESAESDQSEDLRRHAEDPAEGADPDDPNSGEDGDVPRRHPEEPSEG